MARWRGMKSKSTCCSSGDTAARTVSKRAYPYRSNTLCRSRAGVSHRVSNLALACERCNQQKGNRTAVEFGFPRLQSQAGLPLKIVAAVNSTRRALYERLKSSGLPIETSTGGRTKWNRMQRGIPKAHWLDAANVGQSTPPRLLWQNHAHSLTGDGTAEPSDVSHGCPGLPAHEGQETEHETRVSDGRYRACGRPDALGEQGDACGAHGSQSQRCVYDCHEAWNSG